MAHDVSGLVIESRCFVRLMVTRWWCLFFSGVPTLLREGIYFCYSGKGVDGIRYSDKFVRGGDRLKMSCNGCRVLRKGCSESCILRPCLQWIDSADAQGHATVFVAKFFGRAGLMGFITAVPETQRPGMSIFLKIRHLQDFHCSVLFFLNDLFIAYALHVSDLQIVSNLFFKYTLNGTCMLRTFIMIYNYFSPVSTALFQSLLYEACGRTVNPVFGAVGLLWAGNWQVCQAAVETVLKGGSLKTPSPSSQTFSTLPQGPLHPSNPGKDLSAASRGRESLLPSIITSAKECNVDTHDLKVRVVGTGPGNQFLRTNGYESKLDHAVATTAVVKASWDRKWDVNLQPEWPVKQQQQQQGQRPTAKGNVVVNSHVITWPEALGTKLVQPKVGEKREREFFTGAPGVLTPAPRRVQPCGVGEYGMYGHGMTIKDSKFLYDDEETVVGSTEHLDLGLTLMVKDGKGGQITGLKRVYSPSCDSVNSEGSVTSLDTTPRQGHNHHASFSSQMGFGHGDKAHGHMMSRKLLPLLL